MRTRSGPTGPDGRQGIQAIADVQRPAPVHAGHLVVLGAAVPTGYEAAARAVSPVVLALVVALRDLEARRIRGKVPDPKPDRRPTA